MVLLELVRMFVRLIQGTDLHPQVSIQCTNCTSDPRLQRPLICILKSAFSVQRIAQ